MVEKIKKILKFLGWLNIILSFICLLDVLLTQHYIMILWVLFGLINAIFFFNLKVIKNESIE
jgi:hypothetical protein